MSAAKSLDWRLLRQPVHFLALGFGSGLAPRAPGTFGTLAAIPLYLLLAHCSSWVYVLWVLAGAVLGVYICGTSARRLGVHDHGAIVWDEIIGFLIAMFGLPLTLWTLLLGFVLFRLFDISKPWPISWLDRKLHGGLGIMLDDVLAGVCACGLGHAVLFWMR